MQISLWYLIHTVPINFYSNNDYSWSANTVKYNDPFHFNHYKIRLNTEQIMLKQFVFDMLSFVCWRTFYGMHDKDTNLQFEMIDTKNSSNAYVVMYELITYWLLDKNRMMEVLITPMALAHPLHPIRSRSRNKRRNRWAGWCVSSWWPWFWPEFSI